MSSEKPSGSMMEDEENSVTMLDVLQEENALEEDANAVLGASDDQHCTYSKVCIVLTYKNNFFLCFWAIEWEGS